MWIIFIALIVVFIFLWIVFTAPKGYEDEDGFHLDSESEEWEKIYREELQRKLDDAK